jgi:GTPase SAR1 family protein
MPSIKIISNPYIQKSSFEVWDPATSSWAVVNAGSRLLNKGLSEGFFPFKVKEIVDTIVDEYGGGERIDLLFEGTDDEYRELDAICSREEYSGVLELKRSPRWLENARDILPQVVAVFDDLSGFFQARAEGKPKVEEDLEKFIEATDDAIPICVLGNYSSGKSTFINALIGCELLPSGDEPVTARVYRIRRSRQADRGSISFTLGDMPVRLAFDDRGLRRSAVDQPEILHAVFDATAGLEPDMIRQMNRALEVINGLDEAEGERTVSDLIDIEVPTNSDDAWDRDNEFVIFDTPGSNAASHADHQRVLREAMNGMSNGLPVYVCEYSSLDTTDNQQLYDEVRHIEALDDRFTMIIVNKADAAALPRAGFSDADKDRMLGEAIPRSMYAQGMYFVSSIMALGAKIGGDFGSDFYAEKYEDQKDKYINPQSRFYKELYKYDLMPDQIMERVSEHAKECPDKLLANSGLYSVEEAIREFAAKYSSYNKCYQSELLLGKLIETTTAGIDSAQKKRREMREHRSQQLERDKKKLVDDLDACVTELLNDADENSSGNFDSNKENYLTYLIAEDLEQSQNEYIEEAKETQTFSNAHENAEEKHNRFVDKVKTAISDAMPGGEKFRIGQAIKDVTGAALDSMRAQTDVAEAETTAKRTAADRLYQEIEERYDLWLKSNSKKIDEDSKSYWQGEAESARDRIYKLVIGSEGISSEKRDQLGSIVIKYRNLRFSANSAEAFEEEKLHGTWLGNIKLIDSDTLNVERAAKAYNDKMLQAIDHVYNKIAKIHRDDFSRWLEDLHMELEENIVDYNPTLRSQQEIILEETKEIERLEEDRRRLDENQAAVRRMMEWQEGERGNGD